jgi:carboxylesterase
MLPTLTAFQQPEHQPFLWRGGCTAVLLIHGFPGSPAELRPLARKLHEAGFTVQGLLLPGFGPQVETLPQKRVADWLAAVLAADEALRADYEQVWLLGHSMGGALALQAAACSPPTGLILLAPFWQIGRWYHQLIWRLLRPFLGHLRPFKLFKPDFNNPNMRAGMQNWLPEADLDDPAVQAAIRELAVPTAVFEQLRQAGRGGYRAAPQVACPTFVLQGTADSLIKPDYSRRLVQRLAGPLRYQELAADHDLLDPRKPGFPAVTAAVLQFLAADRQRPAGAGRPSEVIG